MPVDVADDEGVVRLTGTLDFATVPDLHRATHGLLSGRDALIVDVSAVGQVNSAGVALLLEWLAEARRRGCDLSFRGLPESVLAVARLSGAEHLLTGQPAPLE